MRLLLDGMYRPPSPPSCAAAAWTASPSSTRASDSPAPRTRACSPRATAEGRAVVTENVADVARLAGTTRHAGIVLVPGSRYPRTRSGLTRLTDALTRDGALDGLTDAGVRWLS